MQHTIIIESGHTSSKVGETLEENEQLSSKGREELAEYLVDHPARQS